MSHFSKRDPKSKLKHIDACLSKEADYTKSNGLDKYCFTHNCIPKTNWDDIDLTSKFIGKTINLPLMIAPMTGGVEKGWQIISRLAKAAQKWKIPIGVGSQRIAIEDKSRSFYYKIRDVATDAIIFANIGAAQICQDMGIKHAKVAVEMIDADAIFIHLNSIQEACQGNKVNFSNLLDRITVICEEMHKSKTKVFIREVGFGMSTQAADEILQTGIDGIDCSGAGGTSWSKVESVCADNAEQKAIADCFAEWGIPTAESIANIRQISSSIPLIATGGLRNGLDIAKSLSLGADLGSMAKPFLLCALEGDEAIDRFINIIQQQLKIAMLGVDVQNIEQLKATQLKKINA